MKPVTIRTEK